MTTIEVRHDGVLAPGQVLNFFDESAFNLVGFANHPVPTFTNYGEVNVVSDLDLSEIIGFSNDSSSSYEGSYFRNAVGATFSVAALGAGQTAFGYFAYNSSVDLVNDGNFEVSSKATAIGVISSDITYSVVNTGSFEVSGDSAIGVDLYNAGALHNSGNLIVTSETGPAIAVFSSGSVSYPVTIENSGAIVAQSNSQNYFSFAIDSSQGCPIYINNSGLIQADFLFSTGTDVVELAPDGFHVVNSGTIRGIIDLSFTLGSNGRAPDTIQNSGRIFGDVYLGYGNDVYDGTGGRQFGNVHGGAGDDTLIGTSGIDALYGDDGNDNITGSQGDDLIEGGAGYDVFILSGPKANYTLENLGSGAYVVSDKIGHDGTDHISGIEAIQFSDGLMALPTALNLIVGTAAADTLTGTAGNDEIYGLDGNDTLYGAAGDDILHGGGGVANFHGITGNALYGGDGNDILDGWQVSVCDGGPGEDTVTYQNAPLGLTVDLRAPMDFMPLTSIEDMIGTPFSDSLTGDNGDNKLYGGGGDDTLNGGLGHNRLDGGTGNNTASYLDAASAVTVSLAIQGAEQDTLGAGQDTLINIHGLIGSDFSDVLMGSAGDDVIDGGSGGNDTLIGGDGIDFASFANSYTHIQGNTSLPRVVVSLALQNSPQETHDGAVETLSGFEGLIGSPYTDFLQGDDKANFLDGGQGINRLDGGDGIDTAIFHYPQSFYTIFIESPGIISVSGQGINDEIINIEYLQFSDGTIPIPVAPDSQLLVGTDNGETLTGGPGNDTLNGLGGDDTLIGGLGDDTLYGGAGVDTAVFAGIRADYLIGVPSESDGISLDGPEGHDELSGIEKLQFADQTINLPSPPPSPNGTEDNDNLVWGSGDDLIFGLGGNDTLSGGAGNDIMDGGPGDDFLDGGPGNDTVSYASVEAAVQVSLALAGPQNTGSAGIDTLSNFENLTGSSFNDRLTGDHSDNVIDGGFGDDVLIGGGGSDTLIGGGGSDTMSGGSGDDTYFLDNIGDVVNEAAGQGTDTIISSLNHWGALEANVENLTITDAAVGAVGNSLNNVITGDGLGNYLDGGTGVDTLIGGDGSDWYVVHNSADVIIETPTSGVADFVTADVSYVLPDNVEQLWLQGPGNLNGTGNGGDNGIAGTVGDNTLDGGGGNDWLAGFGGNDTLIGGPGNDWLDGGTGADTMSGGAGNDIYIVDNIGDVIIENPGEGTDAVAAYVTYTLSANVEQLWLQGAGDINGTGNAGDNGLVANAGNDVLDGQGGNDWLVGGSGLDTLIGGSGDDTMIAGSGLTTLIGGSGNDAYVVNNAADVITENPGEGNDSVASSVSFTLPDNVENLFFSQNQLNLNGTGNASDNILQGNNGDNVLSGLGGNDTLIGGLGHDVFVFNAGLGDSIITDFTPGGGANGDTLDLSALFAAGDAVSAPALAANGTDTVFTITEAGQPHIITLQTVLPGALTHSADFHFYS